MDEPLSCGFFVFIGKVIETSLVKDELPLENKKFMH